ncbi:TetR/AcrR family transcriptional regulator [Demequina gelatinilytica]|uniref:TetR/AcrR family transcriptional regulator n=1 Tax=Demequina gelatinilytica TaxID=1638980 RepID=UPI0007839DE4|nr:TetR/AcrR family transcriptional regulator [Demequina gelatinilytica]
MSKQEGTRVRKDVARNRAALLAAADRLLATRGVDLTFHDVAEEAGLGVGTVYRHFEDRSELLDALIDTRIETLRTIVAAAAQHDDPVEGLREAVLGVCERQFEDRVTAQLLFMDSERHRKLAGERVLPLIVDLVDRVRATGSARADLAATDIPMILFVVSSLARATADVRGDLWRRYANLLLDGLISGDGDRGAPIPVPPTALEFGRLSHQIHYAP